MTGDIVTDFISLAQKVPGGTYDNIYYKSPGAWEFYSAYEERRPGGSVDYISDFSNRGLLSPWEVSKAKRRIFFEPFVLPHSWRGAKGSGNGGVTKQLENIHSLLLQKDELSAYEEAKKVVSHFGDYYGKIFFHEWLGEWLKEVGGRPNLYWRWQELPADVRNKYDKATVNAVYNLLNTVKGGRTPVSLVEKVRAEIEQIDKEISELNQELIFLNTDIIDVQLAL